MALIQVNAPHMAMLVVLCIALVPGPESGFWKVFGCWISAPEFKADKAVEKIKKKIVREFN